MLNQTILVGRLIEVPELYHSDDGSNFTIMNLEVETGNEKDIIPVEIRNDIANYVVMHCKKNTVIGIKARIKKEDKKKSLKLIAEKITFIQLQKENCHENSL